MKVDCYHFQHWRPKVRGDGEPWLFEIVGGQYGWAERAGRGSTYREAKLSISMRGDTWDDMFG